MPSPHKKCLTSSSYFLNIICCLIPELIKLIAENLEEYIRKNLLQSFF